MAGGFAKDGAVQDQIDATIEDAVNRARDQLPRGESLRAARPSPACVSASAVRRNMIRRQSIAAAITGVGTRIAS